MFILLYSVDRHWSQGNGQSLSQIFEIKTTFWGKPPQFICPCGLGHYFLNSMVNWTSHFKSLLQLLCLIAFKLLSPDIYIRTYTHTRGSHNSQITLMNIVGSTKIVNIHPYMNLNFTLVGNIGKQKKLLKIELKYKAP